MAETNIKINQAKTEIIQTKEELKASIMEAQRKQFWLVVSAGTIPVVTIIGTNLAVILNF